MRCFSRTSRRLRAKRAASSHPPDVYDDDVRAPEARIRCLGDVGAAWRLSEASLKNKNIPDDEVSAGIPGAPIDLDRMPRMMARFQDVHRFAILVWRQPGDRALSLVHRLWAGRSFEFAPLSAAASYIEQDSTWMLAPGKIDGADLLYASNSNVEKPDMLAKSPPRFLRAAKEMMYSYVLASAQDHKINNDANFHPRLRGLALSGTSFA